MNEENYIGLMNQYTNEELSQILNCSRENARLLRIKYNGRNVWEIYQERQTERTRTHYLRVMAAGTTKVYRHVDKLKVFAATNNLPWPPSAVKQHGK